MTRSPILRTLLIILLLCSIAAPVSAGPFPRIAFIAMGYKEVTLASLKPSEYRDRRAADPAGFLSVTADFSGDGIDDEARILANPKMGDARVVIVIQSPDKIDTHVLRSVPIGSLDSLAIQLAPAKADAEGKPGLSGLIVFDFDGEAELNIINNGEFEATAITAPATTLKKLS